ncbi:MAG TPA: peptide chain release factor N(5)-glutamine methyltransferase [Bacteroidaceae bacterium]|nr:peptide chain release factor N(5)-glutamine methyltransferase [Bacteroidaceae bacterium]
MLDRPCNLKQLRIFLKENIGFLYDVAETNALIQIVFEHFGLNLPDTFSNPEKPCDPEIIPQINEIVNEIAKNKPIQYILGYTIFYGLKMYVDKRVLIPRPETELLVDMAINSVKKDQLNILDIGTGSGCIAIAMKKNLPAATVMAVDRYPEALAVARKNAKMHDAGIIFSELDFLCNPEEKLPQHFDLIISNPPYVTHSDKIFMKPNVMWYEPPGALFVDGSDPLLFYMSIADYALKHLNKPGDIWLEINENLGQDTLDIFTEKGFAGCAIYKDLHGKERIIHINLE